MAVNVPALTDLLADNHDKAVIDYDRAADVLYINFEPGIPADDSEMVDDILVRYGLDGRIIGYTILNASEHGH